MPTSNDPTGAGNLSADELTYGHDRFDDTYVTEPGSLNGAAILVAALQQQKLDTLFAYPGGANLEIFDALSEADIRIVRTEHEQGAVHAAQGFARRSGRVGVCLATSGPGATNLVTGIADANSDSTPVVAITGNVPVHLLGKNAFQEVDIVSIVKPITKASFQLREVEDIPLVVAEAFRIAVADRPGPVLIDFPKDVQQRTTGKLQEAVARAPDKAVGLSHGELSACLELLQAARRPVIYMGGGIVAAGVDAELVQLAEALCCPVVSTIMGLGAFPVDHPLYFDVLGMHGTRYANLAVNEADVVLALGVRFDDRVTGDPRSFIQRGKIIHIDVDRAELNKNKAVEIAIRADLSHALRQLHEAAMPCQSGDWIGHLNTQKRRFALPRVAGESAHTLRGIGVIQRLQEVTNGEAVVTMGVGQHQMWAMQHYRPRASRRFISSSGFGTMGFGLPAAIGAKLAQPDSLVIDIDGDGSFNMTLQELAVCQRYQVGVKVVVINNQWLGMVRQWQDMIYAGVRTQSDLSEAAHEIYPDFVAIAQGYGIDGMRVRTYAELEVGLNRLLADVEAPFVLDAIVAREDNVYPMIPAGGSYRDVVDP